MTQRSWNLNRRTFLRGTSVSLALPMFDCMVSASETPTRPPRLACVFFANGVSLPPEKHEAHEQWHWFPHGEGNGYEFTDTLRPLESFRNDLSILGGLSHPLGRLLVGHATADIWLTGGDVRGSDYRNTISLDQRIAMIQGQETRFPSIVLSSNGGVGYKTRTATISFNRAGEAIPAESNPRQIFDRLFQEDKSGSLESRHRKLNHEKRMVDLVLDDSKSLQRRLGHTDQRKLAEYLESVHEVERRIERTEAWLDTPRPSVDSNWVNLDVKQDAPEQYIRTMYDLMFLAFQTDTTRVATYQISQEDGKGVSDKFPAIALGSDFRGHHNLSHGGGKEGGYQQWAQYDQFLARQHAYFLKRLKDTQEGEGNLLDNTVSLYGSATSTTHNARNYPLVLAGGSSLGFKHGAFHKYTEETPLANLFVSVQKRLGVASEQFADSTGELSEVI